MPHRVIDAVLMEFDGVLADTAAARRDAMLTVLAEEGITLSHTDYRDRCAGLPTPEAVRGALARCGVTLDETGAVAYFLRVHP